MRHLLIALGALLLVTSCDVQRGQTPKQQTDDIIALVAQQQHKPRFWHVFVFGTCVEDFVSIGSSRKSAEKNCLDEWRWCIGEGYCNQ